MQFYIPVKISNPVTNMCHLTLKIVSIWAIYVMFTKTRVLSANTWIDKEHVSVGGGLGLNYWGFSSVQFSCSVMSDSLWPHGLQHTRHSRLSLTPGVYSDLCPLSQWCHPTISSSVVPFCSCPQSFPASGSFQMSQLFVSDGQSFGVLVSTSVLPMNIQDRFPLELTGLISLQSKGLSGVFSSTTVPKQQFFGTQPS